MKRVLHLFFNCFLLGLFIYLGIVGELRAQSTNCPLDETLTGINAADSAFSVQESIISDQLIQNPAIVEYKAGLCIELESGFEVESGATFFAIIEACTGATIGDIQVADDGVIWEWNGTSWFPNGAVLGNPGGPTTPFQSWTTPTWQSTVVYSNINHTVTYNATSGSFTITDNVAASCGGAVNVTLQSSLGNNATSTSSNGSNNVMMGIIAGTSSGILIIDSDAVGCGPGVFIDFVIEHSGATYSIEGNGTLWPQ